MQLLLEVEVEDLTARASANAATKVVCDALKATGFTCRFATYGKGDTSPWQSTDGRVLIANAPDGPEIMILQNTVVAAKEGKQSALYSLDFAIQKAHSMSQSSYFKCYDGISIVHEAIVKYVRA